MASLRDADRIRRSYLSNSPADRERLLLEWVARAAQRVEEAEALVAERAPGDVVMTKLSDGLDALETLGFCLGMPATVARPSSEVKEPDPQG
jgi:hypothetical protein